MSKSKPPLYEPEEWFDTGTYLHRRFGKTMPEPHEEDFWKLAEIEMFSKSLIFAARNYMVIQNKDSDLVRIDPFIGQTILDITVNSQLRRNLPQRVVEIKPRQVGWTTYNLCRVVQRALHPNTTGMVLVDDEDIANAKAADIGTIINNLPDHLRPMRRIDNLKHIVFDNPNAKERYRNPGLNSQIITTVPSSMRGETPQIVIISEYAFMDENVQAAVMDGLVAAMPLRANSCVIVDTTPQGFDESYYPLVCEAVENNPKWAMAWERKDIPTREEVINGILGEPDRPREGWVPAFCPWFWHEEYTTRDENPRGELEPLSPKELQHLKATLGTIERFGGVEELDLQKKYGVTLGRLAWRRAKISGYKQPTDRLRLLTFRQEYASTWEGCFVNYGHTPFDAECLDAIVRQGRPPAARGRLRRDDAGKYYVDQVDYNREWEELRVYAPPDPNDHYAMGVDTDIAYMSKDADWNVAQIVRYRDDKLVATYSAKVDDHTLVERLWDLYKFYNHPYYGIELQGTGFSLVRKMIDRGASNTHYWKRLDREAPTPSDYPGWQTDEKTRPLMQATLVELISHRDPKGFAAPLVDIPDIPTIRELQTLRRDPTGKIKASGGNKDDHAMALMIAYQLIRDPAGGGYRSRYRQVEAEDQQRKEVNALISRYGRVADVTTSRNRPDLSSI